MEDQNSQNNSADNNLDTSSKESGLAVWEKVTSAVVGVVFIIAILIITLMIPEPTPTQYATFKTILALSAGGFAGILAGGIHVEGSINKLSIRAGGALAVFLLVYMFTPEPPLTKSSVTNFEQTVEDGGKAVTHTGSGDLNVDLSGAAKDK